MLFKIMFFIIRLAPLGVLGAIAFTVGKYGVGSLEQLGMLVLIFYASCIVFVLCVLGLILRLAGFSIIKFLRYMREELMIVLGTASSDSVLPQMMRKLEGLGVGKSTVGLVIPTGYSFNLDGFSIYLTLAAVFIAQATNTPLSFTDLMVILGVSLVTSKGAHGIPGSAIVILAATLTAIPALPVDRAGAGAGGGLVHGDRPGAHQHDRQRGRHRRDRRLGEGHRPGARQSGANGEVTVTLDETEAVPEPQPAATVRA